MVKETAARGPVSADGDSIHHNDTTNTT